MIGQDEKKAAVGGPNLKKEPEEARESAEGGSVATEAKPRQGDEFVILDRHYELTKWYVQAIAKFSRDRRRVLGDRLEKHLYDMLEGLIEARYAKNRLPLLYGLNTKLDMLRLETRLAHELGALGQRQYKHVSGLSDEIGRLLGGWIRQQNNQRR